MQTNKFSLPEAMVQIRRTRCRLRKAASLHPPLPALWRTLSPAGSLPLPSPLHSQTTNHEMRAIDTNNLGYLEEEGDGDDYGDSYNWILGTCITRVLPQALTLEHGLAALKDAINQLELNPPATCSGLIRFEVAVPPRAKALSWFCTEPEPSEVFPQFYVSKESNMATHQSIDLNNSLGIFGIGAAVDFGHLSSGDIGNMYLFHRYLMVGSPSITAYGYLGANCEFESSFLKLGSGSYYFVIPQIELNEYEGVSLLAGTMAWSEDSFCSFKEALSSFHMSLIQAFRLFPASSTCNDIYMKSIVRKCNMIGDKMTQLKNASGSHYFFIRLSSTSAFSAIDTKQIVRRTFTLEDSPNINALWAFLIIEECFRLGLRYFCIAPGSRSSPLAVAASTHPQTICVSCFDERSLAFHAVGYARGSRIPAVVITTSGTAVSNLLPAVVEASQDFVPILLLTADRPPELQECGANQSINQLNHFGAYVRFFFSLPTPTDDISARMVLTAIDSAVFHATTSPHGPVHINCAFREPLDGSSGSWSPSCLDKLDTWVMGSDPFTKYSQLQPSVRCDGMNGLMTEILQLIKDAASGILVIAALNTESETWAALMLARHLQWPVVADILSGMRLRQFMISHPQYSNIIFLDHFDHVLLFDEVQGLVQADVVLQVGSRIASKRISQLLEQCFPCSYILVDSHPYRYDPSHIVSHRIQSTIAQFTNWLLEDSFPGRMNNKWAGVLQSLEMMVSWEISFQISANCSLTEPFVATAISEFLSPKTALFVGNSMAIRDMDMYCNGVVNGISEELNLLPYQCIMVAGNRGASGIDGVLSTAVGFAVGCKRRIYLFVPDVKEYATVIHCEMIKYEVLKMEHVFCVIGDVSFLHDTNGLALLSLRMSRRPMTIIVINNHGGAIFSFLPIVKCTEPKIMNDFFYRTHAISIKNLCAAHSIQHLSVSTKQGLQDALSTPVLSDLDRVIEVESSIDSNAEFHSILRKFASQAASHASSVLSRSEVSVDADSPSLHKKGFIMALSLDDGSIGYGEIAPFQAQEEDLQYFEDQLQFIIHTLRGTEISYHLSLLRGSFSSWIKRSLGLPVHSIPPCIRCGLEMAILNAIAARQRSSLFSVLCPHNYAEKNFSECTSRIQICGLIDHNGTPKEVADIAHKLVREGFYALKLKVARRADPKEDAAVVREVRVKVGPNIEIRVDANRQWTYNQAIEFGSQIKECNLRYIEEPVRNENDIIKFCEKTGLPVALDETLDNIQGNTIERLNIFSHPGIVAVVIKPCFVGGLENAALIARWAHLNGKMAIVSAAFESSLSLSCYVQFARYLDLQNAEVSSTLNIKAASPVAHGLGTYKWLEEDVTSNPLSICQNPDSGSMEASINNADYYLNNFRVNQAIIQKSLTEQQCMRYQLHIESKHFSHAVEVQEIGETIHNNVLLFIHGFLGTGADWVPIMKVFSKSARCISIDLPGHGRSMFEPLANLDASQEHILSVEDVAELVWKLIGKFDLKNVILVGYSMGARIALHMALRFGAKIRGAIIVSGSPGLRDLTARKVRAAKDDSRASTLVSLGLKSFVQSWYAGDLWCSLREHPKFDRLVENRLQHHDVRALAKSLSGLSVGRQTPLWEELEYCKTPLMFIYGEKDEKFKKINQDICTQIIKGVNHDVVEVPESGHAIHVENPLALIRLIRQLFTKAGLENDSM
ncbi:hypothetical protein V2J09_017827 [Rumex salicifolius]